MHKMNQKLSLTEIKNVKSQIQYDWKTMEMSNNIKGIKLPMRLDSESGKIDIWNPEINEWCLNDQASLDFISYLQSKN